MVLIKELRVVLPFTLAEYQVGHLIGHHKFRHRTSTRTVTRTRTSCLYSTNDATITGLYWHKEFLVGSFLPSWAQAILKSEKLSIEAKCWDEYPHVRTVYTIPMVASKLTLSLETIHVENDRGQLDNALGLDEAELKLRTVEHCDITDDKVTDMVGTGPEEDPKLITPKTGRAPLKPGWQKTVTPVMCAYTVLRVDVKPWLLRKQAEAFISLNLQETYLKVTRMTFCWQDDWWRTTVHDARATEVDLKQPLLRLAEIPQVPPLVIGGGGSSDIDEPIGSSSSSSPPTTKLSRARQAVGSLGARVRSRL